MKKLLLCIFFALLALPALADDGSPMWKDFKARWMSVFPAGSVTVQDQGQIKICTLEDGVTATFFLDNDGVVERAVISNMLPSSSRYFEGVAQAIKVLAGQDPQAVAVSAAFATTAPAVLWRAAGDFCFERTQDPGAGWFFYASRGEQCPTEVK